MMEPAEMDLEDLKWLYQLENMMKNRYKSTGGMQSGDFETNLLISRTNQLLRNGLVVSLLKAIKIKLSSNVGILESRKLMGTIKARAYVIFFCLYQTQAVEEEVINLTECIQFLSNLLLEQPVVSPSTVNTSNFTLELKCEIQTATTILHMAHICALQQTLSTPSLLTRYDDINSSSSTYRNNSNADGEVFNTLPQKGATDKLAGRAGMEKSAHSRDAAEILWNSGGAKGLLCLALAVFRQPLVDEDAAPVRDVEWFLFTASSAECRAYSHIRLCVLPNLLTLHKENPGNGIFLIMVLCELLENLAKIFVMSCYKQSQPENDFPHSFFPPTQQFFVENPKFYLAFLEDQSRSVGSQLPSLYLDCGDTLEDVIALYSAVLTIRPDFAHSFLRDDEDPRDSSSDVYVHPFVMQVVESSLQCPTLLYPAIRFVACLAGSSHSNYASASTIYKFVKNLQSSRRGSNALFDGRDGSFYSFGSSPPQRSGYHKSPRRTPHHRFSWEHFFESIEHIAALLRGTPTSSIGNGREGGSFNWTHNSTNNNYDSGLRANMGIGGLVGSGVNNSSIDSSFASNQNYQLNMKDSDGLLLILQLISAVSKNPTVCEEILELYHPIPILFSLISCSIPAIVKGAVLTTISHIVSSSSSTKISRNSVHNQVWDQIESHRLLLPSASTQSRGGSGLFRSTIAGPTSHLAVSGVLKTELEYVENRAGLYPITDGLLQVMEELLCSGEGDIPNQLGEAYRVPGIFLYLEYLVEEVLMKAHERCYYKPQNSSSYAFSDTFVPMAAVVMSSAQRWRLCTRVMHILASILQKYPVNAINVTDVSEERKFLESGDSTRTKVLSEIQADFQVPQKSASSFPKTAGYVVMTYILGKPRFLSCLISLLSESSDPSQFVRSSISEVSTSLEILQYIHGVNIELQDMHAQTPNKKVDRDSDKQLRLTSKLYLIDSHQPSQPQKQSISRISVLDASGLGLHNDAEDDAFTAVKECLCDETLWKEQFVGAAVGLLYECSLREVQFVKLMQLNAQHNVQGIGAGGDPTIPVHIGDLSSLLSAGEGIALIARLASYRSRLCPCLPSVSVLAVRILQHVAVEIPPQRLLGALSTYNRTDRSNGQFGSNIMTACVSAILEAGLDAGSAGRCAPQLLFHLPPDGRLQYLIIHKGCSFGPSLYSISKETTFSSLSIPALPGAISNRSDHSSSSYWQVKNLYLNSQSDMTCSSFSDASAVTQLLLTTLVRDGVCLSHVLLGALTSTGSHSLTFGAAQLSAEANKKTCLDAILELLSPQYFGSDSHTTLVQQCPSLALDCFEILYRICVSKTTSTAVLHRLRSEKFFQTQLTVMLYLMHLTDDELEKGLSSSEDSAVNYDESDEELDDQLYGIKEQWSRRSRVEFVKSSILECTGWLLLMCCHELHGIGTSSRPQNVLRSFLLGSCQSLSFAQERAADCAVIVKIMQFVEDCLTINKTLAPFCPTVSQKLRSLLEEATVISPISKGSAAFSVVQNDTYRKVDLNKFMEALKSQLQDISKAEFVAVNCVAMASNACSHRMAAASHLSFACRRILDLCILHSRSQTHVSNIRSEVLAAERYQEQAEAQFLFSDILVPILDLAPSIFGFIQDESLALNENKENGSKIFEQLTMSITSLIATIDTRSDGFSADQYRFLLSAITSLIVHRSSSSSYIANSFPLRVGSHTGHLILCFNVILKSLTALLSSYVKMPAGGELQGLEGRNAQLPVVEDVLNVSMECIQPYMIELVESLAMSACELKMLWRLSSLATLNSLLFFMSAIANSSLKGSSVYGAQNCLGSLTHTVLQKGVLQRLTFAIGPLPSDVDPKEVNEGLYSATVALTATIASISPISAENVISVGVLDRLVCVPYFRTPPTLAGDLIEFGPDAVSMQKEALMQLHTRLLPTLRLLTFLVTTSTNPLQSNASAVPYDERAVFAAVEFLQRNRETVSHLLRLRHLSGLGLQGLNLTEALVALLASLACTVGAGGAISEQRTNLCRHFLDAYASDVNFIVKVFGSHPFPMQFLRGFASHQENVTSYASISALTPQWWAKVVPSSKFESSLQQTRNSSPEPVFTAEWTEFDAQKLDSVLQILSHGGSFLRALCSHSVECRKSGSTNIIAAQAYIDFDSVATAFCQISACVELIRPSGPLSLQWLTSPQACLSTASKSGRVGKETSTGADLTDVLVFVAENLISLAQDLSLAASMDVTATVAGGGGEESLRKWQPAAASLCAAAEAVYPTHSFARHMARWVADSFDTMQMK